MTKEKTSNYNVTLKVADVMTTEIITIDENASVKEGAEDLLKRVIVEAKSA